MTLDLHNNCCLHELMVRTAANVTECRHMQPSKASTDMTDYWALLIVS